MLKFNIYEGKTEEEAIQKGLQELNVEKNDILYDIDYQEGKLFKSQKYTVKIIKKQNIVEYIQEFFKNISELMQIPIDLEIKERENSYYVTLVSSQNNILIGKEGRTLNAFQIVLKQSIKKEINFSIKLNIDASDYKVKKLKNLERETRKMIEEVISSKIDVSLDPMNSYERRMIHSLVNEYSNVKSESEGEGKERHIVIKYKEER